MNYHTRHGGRAWNASFRRSFGRGWTGKYGGQDESTRRHSACRYIARCLEGSATNEGILKRRHMVQTWRSAQDDSDGAVLL